MTYVIVYIENEAKCNQTYNEIGTIFNAPLLPTQLCAGVRGQQKGPCHGDSGGPLIVPSLDNFATIIGISSESFCSANANVELSDRYTKVWLFNSWIIDNMGQESERIEIHN